MARPRKDGLDYFPHDTDALSDEKIDMLRMLYGNDGYAFYFIMLERIYRQPDQEIDISDVTTRQILARKVSVSLEVFDKMVETAVKYDAFDIGAYKERGVLTSDGIKKRAEAVLGRRNKRREDYAASVCEVETTHKCAETKEKETKEKETELKQPSSPADYTEEFNCFWTVYPRKIGKVAAFKVWKTRLKEKVSPDDLIKAATNYAAECRKKGTEERYIKHPETFIGPDKHYNDYMEVRAVETPAAGVDDQPNPFDAWKQQAHEEMQARRDRKAAALAALAALEVNEKQPATEETLTEEPDNTDDC